MRIEINNRSVNLVSDKAVREHKGNSLIDFPKNYTVIDIETTDFDYFYGEIIEVAAVKYIDMVKVDEFSSLFINVAEAIPKDNPHKLPTAIKTKIRGMLLP